MPPDTHLSPAIAEASRVQFEAATPSHSAWVEASAGSGKTRVLTNRVLRMLLAGVAPHKILCLTYTKTAAANMAIRLGKEMATWATMPEHKLTLVLESLLGHAPSDEVLRLARTLFTRILESPGGMQIQTIHGFCQSVLARFPIEANVPTGFVVLDGTAAVSLRQTCLHKVYQQSWQNPTTPEGQAIDFILKIKNSSDILDLLEKVLAKRDVFEQLFANHHGVGFAVAALYQRHGLSSHQDLQSFMEEITTLNPALISQIQHCIAISQTINEKKYINLTDELHVLLTGTVMDKINLITQVNNFVSTKNTARTVFKKTLKEKNPALETAEAAVISFVLMVREKIALRQICDATASLYILAHTLLEDYKARKKIIGGLDFDDLIHHTAQLFANNSAAWVLYKLDGGIDHVLVDEAQDTNQIQWDILKVITSEFFSGSGTHENAPLPPSVFAVGDYKQSIFSFMGAEPASFKAAKNHYQQILLAQSQQLVVRAFRTSFRTAQPVLSFVDRVFVQERQAQGLYNYQSHISAHEGLAGHIEVWPCAVKPKLDKNSSEPPLLPSAIRLARKIADEIERLVGHVRLEKENRYISYGDIMVLIPKRSQIADAIVRSCKRKGIPITGRDKFILQNELAVMDIMALLNFVLLPDDNLTLATLLRCPLIDIKESDLYALASTRPENVSLWSHLKRQAELDDVLWSQVSAYLDHFLAKADYVSPYEMVASILSSPCPASARGGRHAMLKRLGNECRDPLDELLNTVLAFETSNTPSLQAFCRHMDSMAQEIKRQLEQSNNEVRVMTVHGSKGLEAPVVFVAHIEGSRKPTGPALHIAPPELRSEFPFPLYQPSKLVTRDMQLLQQACLSAEIEDNNRLLYVALTRAEERLIITSCASTPTPSEDGWGEAARAALSSLPDSQPLDALDFPADEGWSGKGLVHYTPAAQTAASATQTIAPPDNIGGQNKLEQILLQNPWLASKAETEKPLSRPLTASTALDEEPGLSPLDGDQTWKFKRGHIIHRLLQTLPALPHHEQASAARNWLSTQDVPHKEQIIAEVLEVLHTPDYAPLFGPQSRAEVPLTGIVGSDIVSGQIDRLAITADEVWIVDYKTNRPAAVALDEVPASYLRQLALYKALLKKLYPNHRIRTFLLWTNLPKLVEIPEEYTAKALSVA